jgi:hypothetical protein
MFLTYIAFLNSSPYSASFLHLSDIDVYGWTILWGVCVCVCVCVQAHMCLEVHILGVVECLSVFLVFSLLDASSIPSPVMQTKMFSDSVKYSLGDKIIPSWERLL